MEPDAPEFNELGTRRLFEVLLFEVFRRREPVLIEDVEKYCTSRIHRSARFLQSTLLFLEWLQLLVRRGQHFVPTSQLDAVANLSGPEDFAFRMAQTLISRLRDTHYFTIVFCEGVLSVEPQTRALYVATSKVTLKFLPLVVLLRNLGLLGETVAGTGLLTADPRLSEVMTEVALTSSYRATSNKLSLARLKALKAAQELQGALAEEYVVALERKRLSTHPRVDSIRSISSEDVGAGFDVVSFQTELSLMHDRFIEVKSFRERACFYWSRNEYEVANRLQDSYHLYIVDINRVEDQKYAPLIVSNPIESMSSEWQLEPDTWLVTLKSA